MYKLISENLTGCGAMGTERIWNNWTKYFKSLKKAKKCAEKDYKKPIEWVVNKGENFHIRSEDLNYVMYHIRQIKTED